MNTPAQRPAEALSDAQLPASWRLLAFLAVLAAVLVLFFCTPLGSFVQDREAIENLARLARNGDFRAVICFIGVSSLLIMVGTPRLIFFTFGSFAFGFWPGLLYSLCGCLTGSFLAFSFARWGAQAWLAERFGERRIIRRLVHARPTIFSIALLRFLPISNALINVGLSLSSTGIRTFLIGSLLGYLPQGIVAALIGSGLAQDMPWTGTLQVAVAGVLLLTLMVWSGRMQRNAATAGRKSEE